MKEATVQLSYLPDVAGGELRAACTRSVTTAIDALARHRAVTAAGSEGAITVYRDDNGNYRCFFSRFMAHRSQETFTTKRKVHAWLKAWFPRLSDAAA